MLIFTGDLPEFPLQMDRPISQKPSPSPRSHPPPPSARCLGVHECVLPTDLPGLIKSPLRTGSFACGFLWGPESLSTCSALTGARIPSPRPTSPQMSFCFAGGGGHGAAAAPNTAVEGEGPSGRAGLQMALHSSPLLSKLSDSTSWEKQRLCGPWPPPCSARTPPALYQSSTSSCPWTVRSCLQSPHVFPLFFYSLSHFVGVCLALGVQLGRRQSPLKRSLCS